MGKNPNTTDISYMFFYKIPRQKGNLAKKFPFIFENKGNLQINSLSLFEKKGNFHFFRKNVSVHVIFKNIFFFNLKKKKHDEEAE